MTTATSGKVTQDPSYWIRRFENNIYDSLGRAFLRGKTNRPEQVAIAVAECLCVFHGHSHPVEIRSYPEYGIVRAEEWKTIHETVTFDERFVRFGGYDYCFDTQDDGLSVYDLVCDVCRFLNIF